MVPFGNEFPRPRAPEKMMVCIVPFDNEFLRPRAPEKMMVRIVPFDNACPRPQTPEEMMVCMVPFGNEFPRPRTPEEINLILVTFRYQKTKKSPSWRNTQNGPPWGLEDTINKGVIKPLVCHILLTLIPGILFFNTFPI